MNESFSQELEIGKGKAGQQPTKSTLLIHQVQKVNKKEFKPKWMGKKRTHFCVQINLIRMLFKD